MKNIIYISLLAISSLCGCSEKLPYQDTSLSAEQRAIDLVGRLTLEEKAALMQNSSPAIPRLGIKPYDWWNEALHGVARNGLATVYPQAISMAASFDDALLQEVFTSVSDEARIKNRQSRANGSYARYQGLTFWTPNVNLFRDPRWGRGQETYGEDPYLTSQMGMAVVRGLQGPDSSRYDKAHACAKHFAVHSGPEWNRHTFNAEQIDPRDLHETYLPAFKDLVVKAGVKEVMCAYNRFEGEPCCGSNRLLQQILRDEWHYKGLVVTDCWALADFFSKGAHELYPDSASSSAAAVLSGTDLECGPILSTLPQAVRSGQIKEADIDRALIRLMTARFELGEMDETTEWDALPDSLLNGIYHQQLALKMARETMTLLQNHQQLLPLKDDMTIALIGPNANDSVMQWGNYNGFPAHTVTLLEAMQQRLPADRLIYSRACDHVSDYNFESLFATCSTAEGPGFNSTYYSKDNFQGEVLSHARQTTPFQFMTDGATVFTSQVPLTGFSCIYQSTFKPQKDAKVTFRIAYTGSYQLLVNGKEVKQNEGHDFVPVDAYTIEVNGGNTYQLELRYAHNSIHAAMLKFDLGEYHKTSTADVLKMVEPADVVVFAGGLSPLWEGEEMTVNAPGFKGGDRTDIELPSVQRNLIAALHRAGKKIVYVNFSGSAIALEPEGKHCDAILQAWYPGEAGGTAIADVLFGDYNPAGRLPVTFYRNVGQLPDFEDYDMKGRTYRYLHQKPLFAFGEGLSYTTFVYDEAAIEDNRLKIKVRNAGKMDGEEVVQFYLQRPDDERKEYMTLRGFKRVFIPAGQSVEVTFELEDECFNWWDVATNTMHPLTGNYRILYGGSSKKEDLKEIVYVFDQH